MTAAEKLTVLRNIVAVHEAARAIAYQRAEEWRREVYRTRVENTRLKLRVAELERDLAQGISAD